MSFKLALCYEVRPSHKQKQIGKFKTPFERFFFLVNEQTFLNIIISSWLITHFTRVNPVSAGFEQRGFPLLWLMAALSSFRPLCSSVLSTSLAAADLSAL